MTESKRLTLTQQIALQKVYEEVALARRQLTRAQGRFEQVATDCGLDPAVNYDIGPDGVVMLAAVQPEPAGST
jgi:hypothetical protein